MHPGREKHETEIVKESWPNFNQDLTFDLQPSLTTIREQFLGKFVTLTVYAILETQDTNARLKRTNSLRNSFRFFTGKEENVEIRKNSPSSYAANRFTFNNRRTIGAVTYNLDPKKFSQKYKLNYATPDVWREVQNIASGIEFEKVRSGNQMNLLCTFSLFDKTLSLDPDLIFKPRTNTFCTCSSLETVSSLNEINFKESSLSKSNNLLRVKTSQVALHDVRFHSRKKPSARWKCHSRISTARTEITTEFKLLCRN